jgi:hypothetical protein
MVTLFTWYVYWQSTKLEKLCACRGSAKINLQPSAYSLYKRKKFGSIEETELHVKILPV